jgi:RNA polymerase sigma factor (sigma-70 family)
MTRMPDPSPLSLLRQLRMAKPEDVAWNLFLQLYEPFVRDYIARKGIFGPDLDDVAQNVFKRAHVLVRVFEHNSRKGAFRKWMHGVVFNEIRTYRRTKARTREQPVGGADRLRVDEIAEPDDDEARWEREHDQAIADRLLAVVEGECTEHKWRVFRRYCLDGVDAGQVAAEFKMTKNAVCVIKSKILTRCRELAQGILDDFPDSAK